MATLYPPIVAGTLPAFNGTSLEVPFSMNRSIGKNEFNGFALKLKYINGNVIGTLLCRGERAIFDTTEYTSILRVGEYYKVQLAYVKFNGDNIENLGIYSTVAVVKYTSSPIVVIEKLQAFEVNNSLYEYQGSYQNTDITEKLYSSRFVLYDNNDNIVEDSGEILHNITNDTAQDKAFDSFVVRTDLADDIVYNLYYIATTVNGLVKSSPRYKIMRQRALPILLNADLTAVNDFDNGIINVYLKVNEPYAGQFVLSKKSEENAAWEEIYRFAVNGEVTQRKLFADYNILQGVKYTYCIQQYNQNNVYSDKILSNKVVADFEDLFLYDGIRQLKVRFNPKVATFKNTVVETKINTLGSKFPFITRNANVDYKELSISGLISYQMDTSFISLEELGLMGSSFNLTSDNIKAERQYKLAVNEWLNNGEIKLFKSPTEGNYIVRLMNISLSPTDNLGRMLHTFNSSAYEIADYDYQNYIKYFGSPQEENIDGIIQWKTIELSQLLFDENNSVIEITQINPFSTLAYPIYHIKAEGLRAGSRFYLGQSKDDYDEIYIGATGSYEVFVDKPYYYLAIPQEEGNLTWQGNFTYGFKAPILTTFDYITDISLKTVSCRRFMGLNPNDELEPDNILASISDVRTNLTDIAYVRFTAKDYRSLYFKQANEGSITDFALNELKYTYTYYRENDASVELVDLEDWYVYTIYGLAADNKTLEPTGFVYDPITDNFYENIDIFKVNVDDEIIDLEETRDLLLPNIHALNTLKTNIGIITDIGYQCIVSTYFNEDANLEIKLAKMAYLNAVDQHQNAEEIWRLYYRYIDLLKQDIGEANNTNYAYTPEEEKIEEIINHRLTSKEYGRDE